MNAPAGILVVEHESRCRSFLRDLFETVGYSVTVAETAEQALEVLNPHRHRLILADADLPHLSGLELIREIRSLVPSATIGLLAEGQDPMSAQESSSLGIQGWLFKPLDARVVLEKTDGWLRRPEAAEVR